MWVFGYGSLVWKVDFPFERKEIGYIKGYERRFYQHSTDHRGTVNNPGRVVTLIPSDNPESKVFGVAYKIKEEDIDYVVNHLDYREKGGYERVSVLFYPRNNESFPFSIIIYLANHENPHFAGYADIKDIAKQVVKCSGPSGANIDYVLNLANSMRKIAPEEEDSHLFDLEKAVLALANS
ncbi:putative glutathione-specific gamma-glutamylcyclotransferase 2 [Coccinella septempunctata]|uniref:putative glutathione-specific gamma-glutamylcyclotransferase 2 n=1 Tax=Coccinella septempunctata TaxID=41139 RepID=UPI001D082150|nr:putative glutathione-specific gamma-glutamylcyclotransferase 2 [Coccinella septempunctata]XP_044761443.1 putative glutathione-specific gamma-glutamylcyclotransferase 2 [Coccinella septempunctata]